jgi:ankyrin repeat protein
MKALAWLLTLWLMATPVVGQTFAELLVRDLEASSPQTLKALTDLLAAQPQLANSAVPAWRGKGRSRPLCVALEKGDLPLVGLLLEKGSDVEAGAGPGRRPPLYGLCASGLPTTRKLQLARRLLEHGARPSGVDARGAGPLHALAGVAADGDQSTPALVDFLAKSGVPLESEDQQGYTPLLAAIMWHNPALVEALLEAGADPDRQSRGLGMDARQLARQQEGSLCHPVPAREVLKIVSGFRP